MTSTPSDVPLSQGAEPIVSIPDPVGYLQATTAEAVPGLAPLVPEATALAPEATALVPDAASAIPGTWPAPVGMPLTPDTLTEDQLAALGAVAAPDWAPGMDATGQVVAPVLDAPDVRSAFLKDMAKLTGVVLAAIVTMQLVVPFIWIIVTLATDPAMLEKIKSGQLDTAQLMNSLGSGMIWMNIFAAVAGALFYLILRGRRMVTTDVTTTIPVGNRWPIMGKGVVIGFGAVFVVLMLNYLVYAITGRYLSGAESTLVGSLNTSFIGVLYIVVIGPVIEELVFRGAILRHLQPYGVNFAIVTQALLFGLYHMNFFQSLHAFILGLVLGYLAVRFSLKWAIALHILNNGLSMLSSTSDIAGNIYTGILAACLVGAIAIVVLDRVKGKPLITEGRSTVLSRPFTTGWTQPFFLIVVIVLFIIGLLINLTMM